MADHDEHLQELARQCATATPLGRLNGVEQLAVLGWLLDNGHLSRTGQPLQQPRVMPTAIAHTTEGKPIFDSGADFSPTRTVTMR